MDATAIPYITATIAAAVGLITLYYTRKTNRETNITELIKQATFNSNAHIDQLQEDLDRYRRMYLENEEIITALRKELRTERRDRRTAQEALRKLLEERDSLRAHINMLEDTIRNLRNV